MTFVQLLIVFPLLPWLAIALRLKRFPSVAAAAGAAFISSGGILLWLSVFGSAGWFDSVERVAPDLLVMMAHVGIGMMVAAVACALIDRR